MILSEKQTLILESLAKYKYLTVTQMVMLEIYSTKSTTREYLIPLFNRAKPFIGKIQFNNGSFGNVEKVHHLTQHGANFLIDEMRYSPEEVKYPKNLTSLFTKDYYHRLNTVYFQIFLNKWLDNNDFELSFCDCYFDKDGANRTTSKTRDRLTAKTKINLSKTDYIIPDGAFVFRTQEKPFFCLFEIHQGKDTLRLFRQISKHLEIIAGEHAKAKYKSPVNNRALFVFELESAKKSALKRIKEIRDVQNFDRYLLFATMESLYKDFFSGWCNIYGQQVNFI